MEPNATGFPKLKIYPRRNQRKCTVMLQNLSYFKETRYSKAPQFRWKFMVDFGDKVFEHDQWSKTEVTADATISGFIIAVTGEPYPEDVGLFDVKGLEGQAVPAVWGMRKTSKSEKETILRFLPLPHMDNPKETVSKPVQKVAYAIDPQMKGFFYSQSEVPVKFSPSKELVEAFRKLGIEIKSTTKDWITAEFNATGLKMMSEGLKDEFDFVKEEDGENRAEVS